MNNRQKITKVFSNLGQDLSEHWAFFVVVCNVCLIAIVTLFPYTFIARDNLSIIMLLKRSFEPTSDIYDAISNIVLFLALGFGLAEIFDRRFLGKLPISIVSLIFSASLSLTVETLQIFLPKRTPSIFDLLTNTTGGVLGTLAFYLWESYFSSRLSTFKYLAKRWLTKSRLTFMALSYGGLIFCLMFSLHRTNNLSNWDTTYPLLVGNEGTGDRPWQGMISQVYFANRSLSAPEITQALTREKFANSTPWITAYELTGNGDYHDQNGLSPDLERQGYSPKDENENAISLSQQHWLLSPPVTELIQSIQQTSQFSLLTTVATLDTSQTGPARIISISPDPFRRNLTIGQQGSRLVVRLRTPLTGTKGNNTELAFPGIFADTNPHQLLFNFDRHSLQLFVDETKEVYTLSLSPEILFFHFLPAIGIRNFQVTPINQWMLKLTFYGLILLLPATLLVLANNNYDSS